MTWLLTVDLVGVQSIGGVTLILRGARLSRIKVCPSGRFQLPIRDSTFLRAHTRVCSREMGRCPRGTPGGARGSRLMSLLDTMHKLKIHTRTIQRAMLFQSSSRMELHA